jgi:hypothetical protein
MPPVWIEPPPIPQSLVDLLATMTWKGERFVIPILTRERRAWLSAYEHARRIAAAREEWPWPTWEGH